MYRTQLTAHYNIRIEFGRCVSAPDCCLNVGANCFVGARQLLVCLQVEWIPVWIRMESIGRMWAIVFGSLCFWLARSRARDNNRRAGFVHLPLFGDLSDDDDDEGLAKVDGQKRAANSRRACFLGLFALRNKLVSSAAKQARAELIRETTTTMIICERKRARRQTTLGARLWIKGDEDSLRVAIAR